MSEHQRQTGKFSGTDYPHVLEVHELKATRAPEELIEAGNLVIIKVGRVEGQLWACESALTIDLDFLPKQVIASISDLSFDRGWDSIKISKLKSYVASASVVPNKRQVRVVYGLHICDDSGTFVGGYGKITLFLVR